MCIYNDCARNDLLTEDACGPLMLGSTTTYIGAIYCAKWFYPELFKDMDPEAIHKEFVEKWIGARFGGIWAYPQAS